jgi:hypothetical protein
MTAHVRRHHQHYKSSGHIWQGRFKAFPIQEDEQNALQPLRSKNTSQTPSLRVGFGSEM